MTAAGSTSYQWDAANRLQSMNSGSLGSYGYDGNGKRRKRKSEGGTLRAEVRLDADREREARMCAESPFWICLQLVRIKAEFAEFGREAVSTGIAFGGREQECTGGCIPQP